MKSREVLGDPMLELAQSVIALSDGVDEARHKVGRGEAMRAAIGELQARQQAVREAVDAASDAASEAPVEAAGAIVQRASEVAEQTVVASTPELDFLGSVSAIDVRLLAAAAAWDRPGSQSEIRARLSDVAADVARLRRPVRRLQPQPAACKVLKRNRSEWVDTVRKRTLALQEQANSAGGARFDQLRKAYRRLPLAVEPRTADRADRDCWSEHSGVAAGAAAMRAAVDDLQSALTP